MYKILFYTVNTFHITEPSKKIQLNQPTRCNSFSCLLFDVYVQLNMFRASSRPSSGAQQLQQQPLGLPLERGGSSAVGRGRPGRPEPSKKIQLNQPTRCNNFSGLLLDGYVQLNMFRASSRPSSGAQLQ
jgi:hypothetical protein